jgi:large subunit ribosomal protein L21
MQAVVKVQGIQYIVKKDDFIRVNKMPSEVGQELVINDVLSIVNGSDVKIGNPLVSNSSVTIKVVEHFKDAKVLIFKKRRRQNSRRKNGHRQQLTKIQILDIQA